MSQAPGWEQLYWTKEQEVTKLENQLRSADLELTMVTNDLRKANERLQASERVAAELRQDLAGRERLLRHYEELALEAEQRVKELEKKP